MNDDDQSGPIKANSSVLVRLLIFVALLIGGFFLLNIGIFKKVSSDAEEQYKIAEGGGDNVQICVQAGFVAAAYLQAKDSINYNKWKRIERTDCMIAGVPR